MHGEELECVFLVKYLKVTISKDLSWNSHANTIIANSHANTIIANANRTLGIVKRNIET